MTTKLNAQIAQHDQNQSQISVDEALKMAMRFHKDNELDVAEEIYQEILRVDPDNPDVLHFFGMLKYQSGFNEDAVELIRKALEKVPNYVDALNNLGNIYLQIGQPEQAIPFYEQILALNPDFNTVYGNLGTALRRVKQYDKAIDHLREAISREPYFAHHFVNLGHVYQDLKKYDAAVDQYRASLNISPGDSEIYPHLVRTFYHMNQKDVCMGVMQEWLEHHPDNPIALHMFAAYTGENLPDRASDDFVRTTFDGFAASFDGVLRDLDYKAPFLVRDAVLQLPHDLNDWCLLDAGCGTGLAGALLRPLVKTIIGVDLSPKMLERAKHRAVYDALHEAELTAFLGDAAHCYDIITCVDTLCYFGDLAAVTSAASLALKPAGYFVFTVEKAPDAQQDAFYLQTHGRYSHQLSYVQQVLSAGGFMVVSNDTAALRFERGEEVAGLVITARRI